MATKIDREKAFFNVISLSSEFADSFEAHVKSNTPWTNSEILYWQMRFQLGILQQLTMISQHAEKAAKAMMSVAAEVERTKAQ